MKQYDWELILEELKEDLKFLMKESMLCDPDDIRNPYTFRIFDLQEQIGLIEQENYEEAYRLLLDDWGKEYLNDFLL